MANEKIDFVEPFYWSGSVFFPSLEMHTVTAGPKAYAEAQDILKKSFGAESIPPQIENAMQYMKANTYVDSAMSAMHEGKRVGVIFNGAGVLPLALDGFDFEPPTHLNNAIRYLVRAHEEAHIKTAAMLGLTMEPLSAAEFAARVNKKLRIPINTAPGNDVLFNEKISDLFGAAMAERRYNLPPGSLAQTVADVRMLALDAHTGSTHFTAHPLDSYQAFHDRLKPTDTPERIYVKAIQHVRSTWSNDTIHTTVMNTQNAEDALRAIHAMALDRRDPVAPLHAERSLSAMERLTAISLGRAISNPEVKQKLESLAQSIAQTREDILAGKPAPQSENLEVQIPRVASQERIERLKAMREMQAAEMHTEHALPPESGISSKRFSSLGKGAAKSLPGFAAAGVVGVATLIATLSPAKGAAAAGDTLNVTSGANPTNGSWVGTLADAVNQKGNDISNGVRLAMDGHIEKSVQIALHGNKPAPVVVDKSKPAPPISQ